jgi:hypothetical protein
MLLGKLYGSSVNNRNLSNAGIIYLMQRKVVLLGMYIISYESVAMIMNNKIDEKLKCSHDPRQYKDMPIGMYHCPECGQMVVAGMKHPDYEEWMK